MAAAYASIDDYLAGLPEHSRVVLSRIRDRVHAAVPEVGETISYAMPTFTLGGGSLVHVGAWKDHVSLYPPPAPGGPLDAELVPYRAGKGTLRFALGEPFPYGLVERIVRQLVQERG